jgi:hypothetical protein
MVKLRIRIDGACFSIFEEQPLAKQQRKHFVTVWAVFRCTAAGRRPKHAHIKAAA